MQLLSAMMLVWLFASSSILGQAPQSRPSSEPRSVIRIAQSADGLEFTDSGKVLVAGASRPDLIRLANGELLAIFEQPGTSPDNFDIAVTCSRDDGKAWLRARQIRLIGADNDMEVSSPELVVMPNGLVRLYFVTHEQVRIPSEQPVIKRQVVRMRSATRAVIRSAVTRDGLEYKLDQRVRILLPDDVDEVRLSAFWTDKNIVLLASRRDATGNNKGTRQNVWQWLSTDARAFVAGERVRFEGEPGHVQRLDRHHWRMYSAIGGEVRSRMSNDGVRWRDEAICMRVASDASVAPLSDKSFIMLFESQMSGQLAGVSQLAAPASVKAHETVQPKNMQATGRDQKVPPSEATHGDSPEAADEQWEPFTSEGLDSETGLDSGGGGDDGMQSSSELFPPKPDLYTRYDYVDWYRQNMLLPEGQSAFESYDVFGRAMNQPRVGFENMFSGSARQETPTPWNPADHPQWDASYVESLPYIDLFRQAASDPRPYTTPLLFSMTDAGEWSPALPEGRNYATVADCLLPCLNWSRQTTEAILSQAWRVGETGVSPDAMRDAWQVGLGSARHLGGSATLIEHLSGARIRSTVESNARWALHWNVFTTPEQLEQAYQALRDNDPPMNKDTRWLGPEYAMQMDLIQTLFVPTEPGGEPKLNVQEAKRMLGGEEDLSDISVEDAYAAIEALDQCFHELESQLATGYPAVKAADVDSTVKNHVNDSKVARSFMPSYSRAIQTLTRTEASRRATQLAYAVELFRMREGRLPSSLDEVAADDPDIRVDPFSGTYFGYQTDGNGARIYSVGENGVDDGGQHLPHWGTNAKFEWRPTGENSTEAVIESDDYVFWPPQE